MLIHIFRRMLLMIPVFVIVSFGTFMLARYAPGDPVLVRAGPRADPEVVERIRHELGLDKPVIIQYVDYMGGFVTGDLGESISKYPGTPVAELIFPRMFISAQLGGMGLFLVFFIGIAVGILAALKRGKWLDPFLISISLFFHSIPSIIFVPVLLYIMVLQLHLVPASLPGIVGPARLMRVTLLAVLGEDYIRTARAKGLPEWKIVLKHALRNAMLPMTTVIGLSLVSILEGSFFIEQLYGIPGIGSLALDAVYARDYDIIMALTMIVSGAFLVVQLITDIIYTLIDPRVSLEGSSSE